MPYNSEPASFEHAPSRKKVTFDPTINLGHVLTMLAFVGGGSVAYFDLRERISNNEIRTHAVAAEMAAEKTRTQQSLLEMRDDVREVRRGVNELLRSTQRGK